MANGLQVDLQSIDIRFAKASLNRFVINLHLFHNRMAFDLPICKPFVTNRITIDLPICEQLQIDCKSNFYQLTFDLVGLGLNKFTINLQLLVNQISIDLLIYKQLWIDCKSKYNQLAFDLFVLGSNRFIINLRLLVKQMTIDLKMHKQF